MQTRLTARRGFSLVESLTAFAILALSLSQLLNGVGLGARNEARADFLLRAARQGASHLDSLGVDGPLPIGQTTGRYSDGLSWSLLVTPGDSARGPQGAALAETFHARLTISKPNGVGERFTLQTTKIRAVEQKLPPGGAPF
jgi:type II secretory pathway pseudopilin PulG